MGIHPRDRPHLYVDGGSESEPYRYPGTPVTPAPPERNRKQHGDRLQAEASEAVTQGISLLSSVGGDPAEQAGFLLNIVVPESHEADVIDKLENKAQRIEVLAVRSAGERLREATIFVPTKAASFFPQRIEQYRTEDTKKKGRPRHEPLVARIESIRLGDVLSLITTDHADLPDADTAIWWEVWFRKGHADDVLQAAQRLDIRVGDRVLRFPEREVRLLFGSTNQLHRLVLLTGSMAELRVALDTPRFFMQLRGPDQQEWADDLLQRLTIDDDSIAVCLLDTGVRQGHPLLSPFVSTSDQYTINDAWGVADDHGHGTGMAGLAIYGDLFDAISRPQGVSITHRLESVKIIHVAQPNDKDLYGAITDEAVALAEYARPQRRRVICLAVTSDYETNRGRPSSWSAAIDQLAYGDGETPRLVVLAAGNLRDEILAADYPDRNDVEEIESPAQAWNALTIGAYTDKSTLEDPAYLGWSPLAEVGALSPRSRTSVTWERQWPIKPDVVVEGGNVASDGSNPCDDADDLRLLTTAGGVTSRLYTTFGDTSGATATAAAMCAVILRHRPAAAPETVRALLIHSSEWTSAMLATLPRLPKETDKLNLVRRFGYGVPNLDRARLSAKNDLTLVVEDSIQPYEKPSSSVRAKEMNLHKFPWPVELLEEMGDEGVEMRVTLSYFIEPNPGERGRSRRHRYVSHGLRMEVKGSIETEREFRARINTSAREEDSGYGPGLADADKWVLGRIRNLGSVHSDIWRGSALELSQRDAIAVYPVGGWWKESTGLGRYDRPVRYSLVVSIRAPEVDVDLYTPVSIGLRIPVGVRT